MLERFSVVLHPDDYEDHCNYILTVNGENIRRYDLTLDPEQEKGVATVLVSDA